MIATPNSGPSFGRNGGNAAISVALLMLSSFWTLADQPAPTPQTRATTAYTAAKQVWQKNPNAPDAAWQFSRACFDLAEINEPDRARLAQEGIDACRKSLATTNKNAGNQYYLALNLGQLARTRRLGALKLVEDMEKALKKTIELDPKFDYAGAHRSLGMLYRDAPGWPMSIGSRSKAQQHLLKAVELAPDFPDNHISLIESYIEWADFKAARTAVSQAESPIRQARLELTGDRWKDSWRDWDQRWERIRRRTDSDLTSPRGKQ